MREWSGRKWVWLVKVWHINAVKTYRDRLYNLLCSPKRTCCWREWGRSRSAFGVWGRCRFLIRSFLFILEHTTILITAFGISQICRRSRILVLTLGPLRKITYKYAKHSGCNKLTSIIFSEKAEKAHVNAGWLNTLRIIYGLVWVLSSRYFLFLNNISPWGSGNWFVWNKMVFGRPSPFFTLKSYFSRRFASISLIWWLAIHRPGHACLPIPNCICSLVILVSWNFFSFSGEACRRL